MAYTSGTAANYKDLLAILVTFASANGWVVLEQAADKVYLKGTGLSGLDEIYVGIDTYENTGSSIYNWNLYGSWGYVSGRQYPYMPHSSYASGGTSIPRVYLWNNQIPYWIIANPRRIIGVAKVSTYYETFTLGLLNPIGTEKQYPYPLLIGGSNYESTMGYTSTSLARRAWWSGAYNNQYYNGRLHMPHGAWFNLHTSETSPDSVRIASPYQEMASIIMSAPDGSYMLEELYVFLNYNSSSNKGIMAKVDGMYRISGYQQTPENIVTANGVNYLVVPNIFRSDIVDYAAMRLN